MENQKSPVAYIHNVSLATNNAENVVLC